MAMKNEAKTEFEKFNSTMKKVLSVSKQELQRRLEREKQAKSSVSRAPASSR
jgi:hypothetical protein